MRHRVRHLIPIGLGLMLAARAQSASPPSQGRELTERSPVRGLHPTADTSRCAQVVRAGAMADSLLTVAGATPSFPDRVAVQRLWAEADRILADTALMTRLRLQLADTTRLPHLSLLANTYAASTDSLVACLTPRKR